MSEIPDWLEAEMERRHQAVRAMLSGQALAEYDASIEYIRSGQSQLANLWHSISPAQRRLMQVFRDGQGDLIRTRYEPSFYDFRGDPNAVSKVARATTVKALIAHKVLFAKDDAGLQVGLADRGYALIAFLRAKQ